MTKIAMIGAGSVVFSQNLTGDILSFPELKNCTLAYMDIDPERLAVGEGVCKKVAEAVGAKPEITATLDRREALDGADFVINMVQVGGAEAAKRDYAVGEKYGIKFSIGDTIGPGGVFRGLRSHPVLKAMCADMEELCPGALLLNYSNPMAMNMLTVFNTSKVRAVGLCHSVQGTASGLARYIGEKIEDVNFFAAGLNHMCFYLRFEKDGQDLYPRLFEAMKDPEVFNDNAVRFEMMRRLGYFVSESSEHMAEYVPYFIHHGEEMIERYRIPIGELLRRDEGNVRTYERTGERLRAGEPVEVRRSAEYGSLIIHSMVTGERRVIYGNVPNDGIITNLPPRAVVEVPCLVDRNGIQPVRVGDLPPQVAGILRGPVSLQLCFIEACLTGRKEHVYHAVMLDPHTASQLTLEEIWSMTDDLFEAHKDWLPPLE